MHRRVTELSTSFAPDVQVLARLRDFARDAAVQLEATVDPELLAVVVGELTANAAVHQSGPARLIVTRCEDGGIEVSVEDGDPAMPWVDDGDPADVLGHRGLRMVQALTPAWGVERAVEGKRVWAVVPSEADPVPQGARR